MNPAGSRDGLAVLDRCGAVTRQGLIALVGDPALGGPLFIEGLSERGHQAVRAESLAELLQGGAQGRAFDLVFLELPNSRIEDTGRIQEIKRFHASTMVVVVAPSPSTEFVIRVFRAGAFDFVTYPPRPEQLLDLVDRAVALRDKGMERRHLAERLEEERRRVTQLRRELGDDPFGQIKGTSDKIRRLVENMREVARTDCTVLITGESGTGKGLFARALHDASNRSEGPFVEASCVAYSEGILHSELFGHEKGAFTGAIRKKKGRFEMASGGTIFLDEIGEISHATQLLLLRVLQDHTFERVGGEETLEADARLVAATSRNLQRGVEEGSFRKDLYYRLNVIPVHIPPLREHPEDVPVLAQYFLVMAAQRLMRPVGGFSPEVMQRLARHRWPGNVRELENMVERLVAMSRSSIIGLDDIPEDLGSSPGPLPARPGTLRQMEIQRILETLRVCGGNKKLAAQSLGIHRTTLYARMRRYGIPIGEDGGAQESAPRSS